MQGQKWLTNSLHEVDIAFPQDEECPVYSTQIEYDIAEKWSLHDSEWTNDGNGATHNSCDKNSSSWQKEKFIK